MTTYVIGLVIVALVYGLFWNNGSARSYAHGALDADSPPAQPGSYPDGAVGTPRPTSKPGPTRTEHPSNRPAL
jgi:hypothetical protein